MYRTKLRKRDTLGELHPGESATVTGLGMNGALRKRLTEMGLTPGATVTVRRCAPLGDPMQVRVRGYELALRRADARKIAVARERGPRHGN